MKPKTLIPLALVLVVLGVLVVVRSVQDRPPSITEEVVLTPLMPEGLTLDKLGQLEVYAGIAEDEKIVLTKNVERDRWEIASHFNAPVKESKIEEYIGTLLKLKGEAREPNAPDERLESYDLTPDLGFHIAGYEPGSEDPIFHVLVGKSIRSGSVFMRIMANNDIYVADSDLRQDAGIYSDERSETPRPGTWLDTKILELEKDRVKRISLTFPDKKIVLEHREKPSEEPESAESDGEEESDAEESEAEESDAEESDTEEEEDTEARPVEYEWVVASGGIGKSVKESAVNALLSKISNLSATDVVDPEKKDEWKLDPPIYEIRVQLEGETDEIVLEGGRPRVNTNGYMRLAESTDNIVYRVNRYGFEQLFPKGTALFDLPELSFDLEDIERIEYHDAGVMVVLGKKDGDWIVTEPQSDLPPVSRKLTTIASTLASWRAEDYADSQEDTGLDQPERTVSVHMVGGGTHTIDVGSESRHFEGSYAVLTDSDLVLAITNSDVNKIFVPRKDLFERALFDIDEEDIAHITVTHGEETYTLDKDETGWKFSMDDETLDAVQDEVDDLTEAIAGAEADDLIFDDERAPGEALGSLAFTLDDGTAYSFAVETETGGNHIAVLSGINTALVLSADSIGKLLPAFDNFVIPPEEETPEEETPEEETPEEEIPEEEIPEDIAATEEESTDTETP